MLPSDLRQPCGRHQLLAALREVNSGLRCGQGQQAGRLAGHLSHLLFGFVEDADIARVPTEKQRHVGEGVSAPRFGEARVDLQRARVQGLGPRDFVLHALKVEAQLEDLVGFLNRRGRGAIAQQLHRRLAARTPDEKGGDDEGCQRQPGDP